MSVTAAKSAWVERVLGIRLPADGAPKFNSQHAALDRAASVQSAIPSYDPVRSLRLVVAEAAFLATQDDDGSGQALLDRATNLMHGNGLRTALGAWHSARAAALGSLSGLAAELRASDTPGREAAATVLEAAGIGLDERPDTLAAVELMQRLVESDPVLAASESPNVFGMRISVRAPLTTALASIRASLIAQQWPG